MAVENIRLLNAEGKCVYDVNGLSVHRG